MILMSTPDQSSEPRILVVDDDPEIRRQLSTTLEARGFRVTACANASDAGRKLSDMRVDLVLLDVMLPGVSGLAFCRELRAKSDVPIILLTALSEEADRVVGLEFGADDYIVKPFSAPELVARIRAAIRRYGLGGAEHKRSVSGYEFGGWRLDTQRRELVSPDGVLVDLTSAEFELLNVLVERAGRVLSRETLLDLTRGRDYDAFDRSIDVLISRLRTKLGDAARAPSIIKTVHAAGYVFAANARTIDEG